MLQLIEYSTYTEFRNMNYVLYMFFFANTIVWLSVCDYLSLIVLDSVREVLKFSLEHFLQPWRLLYVLSISITTVKMEVHVY